MKIMKEMNNLLSPKGPLHAERISRFNVKLQQVEAKLKILSDIDEDILSKCNIDDIEYEINKPKAVIARIIDCQQRIHEAIKLPNRPFAVPVLTLV